MNYTPTGFSGQSNPQPMLKPCPFCGRGLERHTEGYGVNKVAYRHPLDTSQTPCFLADSWFFESEDEIIRWNRRVNE